MSELALEYNSPVPQEITENERIPAKKAAAQSYNRSAGALALHYVILNVVQIIIMIILACICGPDTNILEGIPFMIIIVASYAVSNPLAYIIGLAFTKRLKGSGRLFSKPNVDAGTLLLAIPVALAAQSISILLQLVFIALTGSSGTENINTDILHFCGNTVQNILLFAYMVIIAPIGEELIMRGMVLRNSSCVSRTFAIVFSSVLFGLLHGNIMQFFTGVLAGLLFAYADIKAGSVIPSIILHIAVNLSAFGLSAAEYYLQTERQTEILYFTFTVATIIAGAVCMIFLYRRLKSKEIPSDSPYAPVYELTEDERKKCTIVPMLKSPCVWVFSAVYLIFIVINIFAGK